MDDGRQRHPCTDMLRRRAGLDARLFNGGSNLPSPRERPTRGIRTPGHAIRKLPTEMAHRVRVAAAIPGAKRGVEACVSGLIPVPWTLLFRPAGGKRFKRELRANAFAYCSLGGHFSDGLESACGCWTGARWTRPSAPVYDGNKPLTGGHSIAGTIDRTS